MRPQQQDKLLGKYLHITNENIIVMMINDRRHERNIFKHIYIRLLYNFMLFTTAT